MPGHLRRITVNRGSSMFSSHPLLRRMRCLLADQERALRATALAESSHLATGEIRSLYMANADAMETAVPARAPEATLSVSMPAPQQAG